MTKKPSFFVAEVDPSIAPKLKKDLENQGFTFTTPEHTLFAAQKKGISCTLYKSGKLVVQGKDKDSFIEFYLEPEVLGSFDYTHKGHDVNKEPHIGIDESGKGDFFGPLCIAGVYADADGISKLLKIGVQDSKKISDKNIRLLAKEIRSQVVYHGVRINPPKYNELYQRFGNLNHLLAWGHATTIEQLIQKTNCHNALIDQFADEHVVLNALKRKGLSINLTQRHKGEEDPVVAAASILARDLFLQGMEQLSEQFGINFHKGASQKTIEDGRSFIDKHGKENLPLVCKAHFKTLREL